MNAPSPYEVQTAMLHYGYGKPIFHTRYIDNPEHVFYINGEYYKTYVLNVKHTHALAWVSDADLRRRKKLNYNKYANIYDLVGDAIDYLEKVAYEDSIKKGEDVVRKIKVNNIFTYATAMPLEQTSSL